MTTTYTVGYFVGSLAKGSLNRKLALALARLAPKELVMKEIAIDWASRPYGQNSFARKPSAVIGTSPGKIGTAVAQQHLHSILGFCNSPQMKSPEAYIQFEKGLIGDAGEVTNASTEKFLRDYMLEFCNFITRVYTVLPRTT